MECMLSKRVQASLPTYGTRVINREEGYHQPVLEDSPVKRPNLGYIEKFSSELLEKNRAKAVDWLGVISADYHASSEIVCLAVLLLDQFMSRVERDEHELNLVAASCFRLALKHEDPNGSPSYEDLSYYTNFDYKEEDFENMEHVVVKTLYYEIGSPTVMSFVSVLIQEDSEGYQPKISFLGRYLAELSLLDSQCLMFMPSLVAASVVFLSRFTLNDKVQPWTSNLEEVSGYKAFQLKECVLLLQRLQLGVRGGNFVLIRNKFRETWFLTVSDLRSPRIPFAFFSVANEKISDPLVGQVNVDAICKYFHTMEFDDKIEETEFDLLDADTFEEFELDYEKDSKEEGKDETQHWVSDWDDDDAENVDFSQQLRRELKSKAEKK